MQNDGGGPSSPTAGLAGNCGRARSSPAVMNLNGIDNANIFPPSTNDSVAIDIDFGAQTLEQNIKVNYY